MNTPDANSAAIPISLNAQKLFIIQFRAGKKLSSFSGLPFPVGSGLASRKKMEKIQEKSGLQFLPPIGKTDISVLVYSVVKHFKLVSAFIEFLPESECYLVQFTFAKKDDREISSAFKDNRWRYLKILENIADRSYWRTRGYENPLPNGESMVVLNCHMPIHRYQGNGEPVTAWKKDADGKHVGEKAMPIAADYLLEVSDDSVIQATPVPKE